MAIFDGLQRQILRGSNQVAESGDRAQLSSIRGNHPAEPMPPLAAQKPVSQVQLTEPVKPKSPWSLDSTPAIDTNAISPALSPTQFYSGDVSPLDAQLPRLIPTEIVNHRLSMNDEWLEKRRQSRLLWNDQRRQSSMGSIFQNQNAALSPISPPLDSMVMTASPFESSRLSGSSFPVSMARDQSQTSHGTRSSRTSSLLHDIPETSRHDSTNSQESLFGLRASLPLSPPLREHRRSAPERDPIATTINVPNFGSDVESGLEVASSVDERNGLILASEGQDQYQSDGLARPNQATLMASTKSVDYLMRHDASFYKFGGFCEGARAILRGDPGFKIVKRPSVSYHGTCFEVTIDCLIILIGPV